MGLKIVSNNDGFHSNGVRSFSSYAPNTYRVQDGDEVVGSIEIVPNYDLSNLNPDWSGTDKVWMLILDNGETFASQRLAEVRAHAKAL